MLCTVSFKVVQKIQVATACEIQILRIEVNSIQCNTLRYNTILCNTIQSCTDVLYRIGRDKER